MAPQERQADGPDRRSTRSSTATSATNIPTADAHDFRRRPRSSSDPQVRYARDESLDPQLVWRGKYALGRRADLVTDAPPIYIQEKIDPRVLIENLRPRPSGPRTSPS